MTKDAMSTTGSDERRRAFVAAVAKELGRPVTEDESRLAISLVDEKSAALVARELEAAPVTDPKKIRPEHKDTANERTPPTDPTR